MALGNRQVAKHWFPDLEIQQPLISKDNKRQSASKIPLMSVNFKTANPAAQSKQPVVILQQVPAT